MKVELIDHSKNAEETIAQGAGMCYGQPDKDVSRITRLKQHGHLATFRFAHAVFKVEDISRACQNQIVRHKHLDFLVESQRYVDQTDRGFVMPDISDCDQALVSRVLYETEEIYTQLINGGVSKEDARAILPANTMTSMYIAGNFQAWSDALNLRVDSHAQKEIRTVFLHVWNRLNFNFPLAFPKNEVRNGKIMEEWMLADGWLS